jgi:DnaJ-class molecular chaperone
MTRPITYYQTLGIAEDATAQAVRAAYRRLAQKHHPDRNKDGRDAADTMARINQAYAVLSHEAHRAQYDASLASASRPAPMARADGGDYVAAAGKKPWLILSAVISLALLVLGWVAIKTAGY